jgi:hypothetical protein
MRRGAWPPLTPFRRYLFLGLSIREEKQMTIDESIARVKELIQKREEIDAELAGLFGLNPRVKKTARCTK